MQLIGMLDSPYVRRVAISLQLLGLSFAHTPLSVFSSYDDFKQINPVVKAPTLILDDGQVLMDSTLILLYAETLATSGRQLISKNASACARTLRLTGLALAACEKSVQIVYERRLRPVEKQHEPWVTRVTSQLLAAYAELEAELRLQPLATTSDTLDLAGVSTAVAWQFTQSLLPEVVPSLDYPALDAFSALAESLPEFVAAPHGNSTYRQAS